LWIGLLMLIARFRPLVAPFAEGVAIGKAIVE
jgi:hypothetical protein